MSAASEREYDHFELIREAGNCDVTGCDAEAVVREVAYVVGTPKVGRYLCAIHAAQVAAGGRA